MKLINVRLDAQDARKADALRKQGVEISSIVREAIRAEYERRRQHRRDGRTAAEMLSEIYAKYPDPPDVTPRDYDVHDAKQARAAIVAKLKKGRQ
ncbi:MAG TPA: hypothetical protein VH475_09360 [Tepidisphaeraceae bacterium]|jgi:post-segregation antitoxin (ccd killing protein)